MLLGSIRNRVTRNTGMDRNREMKKKSYVQTVEASWLISFGIGLKYFTLCAVSVKGALPLSSCMYNKENFVFFNTNIFVHILNVFVVLVFIFFVTSRSIREESSVWSILIRSPFSIFFFFKLNITYLKDTFRTELSYKRCFVIL